MVDFKKLLDNIPKEKVWKGEVFNGCDQKYESKYGPLCKLLDDKPRLIDRRCGFYVCKKVKK